MAWIPLFAPLVGFLIVGLFGRRLGDLWSGVITTALVGAACLVAWSLFPSVVFEGKTITQPLFTWIEVGSLSVSWGLHLDTLCLIMVCVVTTVSFLVHLYSMEYMSHDKAMPRFMAFLSLFTFMMLMLVTADNFIQLFFGWEGVGLASYLLIGFWYHKPSANAAAMKAFIVNRVGDLGLVLALGLTYSVFGTLNIADFLHMCPRAQHEVLMIGDHTFPILELAAFFFFIGAMGKSAQLGLHTWLPDAMEGPTPVSALIHAATMVTAGVFLVARLSPLYELAPLAREFVTFVGASTALFAATIALTQNDIKRVIAYSTCSQLGYMFFAAGVSAYNISIFHLATHAFFKALLFLGAGAVIHAMSDEQDLRKMGGIWRAIPVSCTMMWVGSLALAGIPFFAGYYSKDAILEAAWQAGTPMGRYAFWMGIAAAGMTAFYSWRLLYLAFAGKPRADEKVMGHLHEPGMTMLVPLFVLSIGAVFSGYIGHMFVEDPVFWQNALALVSLPEAHLPLVVNLMPQVMAVGGILLATYLYLRAPNLLDKLTSSFAPLYQFSYNKWYVDELYNAVIVKPLLRLGEIFWVKGDQATIDAKGPDGFAQWAMGVGARMSAFQTGRLSHYMMVMLLGLCLLLGLLWATQGGF